MYNQPFQRSSSQDPSVVLFVGDLASICTEQHLSVIFQNEG